MFGRIHTAPAAAQAACGPVPAPWDRSAAARPSRSQRGAPARASAARRFMRHVEESVKETLETRIDALLTKERLHELEMAYCRGIDRRDPDLIRSIYFPDAIEDHGSAWSGTGYEWVDYIFADYLLQFEVTAHYVLN